MYVDYEASVSDRLTESMSLTGLTTPILSSTIMIMADYPQCQRRRWVLKSV